MAASAAGLQFTATARGRCLLASAFGPTACPRAAVPQPAVEGSVRVPSGPVLLVARLRLGLPSSGAVGLPGWVSLRISPGWGPSSGMSCCWCRRCRSCPSTGSRVLLVRHARHDDGWGVLGGAVEVGESPAAAAVRETREETGADVDVELVRLADVLGGPDYEVTYPNGDRTAYVTAAYEARIISGSPAPVTASSARLLGSPLDSCPACS